MSERDDELLARVDLLLSIVGDLEEYLEKWDGPIDLGKGMDARSHLKLVGKNNGALSQILVRIETLIGESMGGYRTVVEGHGQIERHRRTRQTHWKHDDLLRMVLDTRKVDDTTGEIESDVSKIRDVWSLAGYQARRGTLKARGITPEDFCETEELPGWQLRDH